MREKYNSLTVSKASFSFVQEGNAMGTTEEYEELKITVDSPIGAINEDGGFLTLYTSTGWSFDDKEELEDIIDMVTDAVYSMREKD